MMVFVFGGYVEVVGVNCVGKEGMNKGSEPEVLRIEGRKLQLIEGDFGLGLIVACGSEFDCLKSTLVGDCKGL